jgi:hypothetical protein
MDVPKDHAKGQGVVGLAMKCPRRLLVGLLLLASLLEAASAHALVLYYDQPHPGSLVQNQIVVHESTDTTYYCILGNAFGYGGIQQGWGTRNYIFSLWDQNQEKTMLLAYSPDLSVARIGRFGDDVNLEGTGFQLLFFEDWQLESSIRMAYRASLDPDGQHLRLSGFYRRDDDPWRYAGTFRLLSKGALLAGFYGFVENFGGTTGPRKVSYSNHWLNDGQGTWTESLNGLVLPQNEGVVTAVPGGTVAEYATPTQADFSPIAWTTLSGNAPVFIPYRIDCGRESVVTVDNDRQGLAHLVDDIGGFEVDGYFSGGDFGLGTHAITLGAAVNPAPESVYRSARAGQDFTYALVGLKQNANHLVRLHFAELQATAAGQRRMDVSVNGAVALANFDVFAEAGGAFRALVRELPGVTDASGSLAVRFKASPGSSLPAAINGMEATAGTIIEPTVDGGSPGDANLANDDVPTDTSIGGAGGGSGGSGSGGAGGSGGGGSGGSGSGGSGGSGGADGIRDVLAADSGHGVDSPVDSNEDSASSETGADADTRDVPEGAGGAGGIGSGGSSGGGRAGSTGGVAGGMTGGVAGNAGATGAAWGADAGSGMGGAFADGASDMTSAHDAPLASDGSSRETGGGGGTTGDGAPSFGGARGDGRPGDLGASDGLVDRPATGAKSAASGCSCQTGSRSDERHGGWLFVALIALGLAVRRCPGISKRHFPHQRTLAGHG